MRASQIFTVVFACFAYAASLEIEGALRGAQEHGRELIFHIIPILIGVAHGATAAVHSIGAVSALTSVKSVHTIKFTAQVVKIELKDGVKEMAYKEFCKEIIEYASQSPEDAQEALKVLRDIYGDAAKGLTAKDLTSKTLKCVLTEKKKDESCIGGDNTILLKSGASKLVRHLAVGDVVQTSASTFEPILMLPPHKHANRDNIVARFLRLATEAGSEVVLSPGHFLPIVGKGLLPAADVRLGDSVIDVWGNTSAVIRVTPQRVKGVYFPLTPSCKLVVENVQVSCASESSWTPYSIELALAPFHVIQKFVPARVYELVHTVSMFIVNAFREFPMTLATLLFAVFVHYFVRSTPKVA